ncbi:unnamed protein product [Effrenium voratum]|nr:unnamed protein product [Effrenium voratum]
MGAMDDLALEEEPIEPLQRACPVQPGHLFLSLDPKRRYEGGASEGTPNRTLALLMQQHREVMQRFDYQDEILIQAVPRSPKAKRSFVKMRGPVLLGDLQERHKDSPIPDIAPPVEKEASVEKVASNSSANGEVKRGSHRKSFTPALLPFDQFDLALKRSAASADGTHRRKRYASVRKHLPSTTERAQWFLQTLVLHPAFDLFFGFVVLASSVFIGIEVQQGLGTQDTTRPPAIYVFQYSFTFLFALELVLRLLAEGWRRFLFSEEWMWNWFDAFIVITSLWELVMDIVYVWHGDSAQMEKVAGVVNLKAFRVIRITRVVKAVRLMRIFRFVIALRTLITSIMHTLVSLFWALALLILIVYVFAVLFVQAVHDHLSDPDLPSLSERELEASQRYFGSLADTMLSLFMCIAGGVNWVDVQEPLKGISTMWVFFFLFYIAFTYFAVLNVVTGVFCQSSILANKEAHVRKIHNLFTQFDQKETGVITFAMLEARGGAVEIEEFLMGCLRLRGQARAIDVEKIIYEQTWLIKSQGKFHTFVELELKQMKAEQLHLLTGKAFRSVDSYSMLNSPEQSVELAAWPSLLENRCAAELRVTCDATGGFKVSLDGMPWLESGEVRVGNLSSGAGLQVAGRRKFQSQDALGRYTGETFAWAHTKQNVSEVVMETTVKSYEDDSLVVFEQHFPKALPVNAAPWGTKMSAPATLFPSFRTSDLDCFAYHGVFPSLRRCKLSSYAPSHQGGAPLVLYQARAKGAKALMTVFAPLGTPKAQHMFDAGDGLVGAGVKGTVTQIPAGWRQRFVLSAGKGILDGMMAWGDHVLKFTGKPRADMYRHDVVGSIGFWTDNGGYYHYATGSNATYEEVLPKVKAYHDSLGVPFKHWQFDSWFYPKDGSVDPGGGGGAVVNWTALDSVFPRGMAYIQSQLQVPMVMHNRQWSPASDYIKHEPFKWYASKKAAVPQDPEAFFRWFFTQQEGWGLAMYEQDWMCTEYDTVEALQSNVSLADEWLRGMAVGAASSNRTVQYCMPYPYDVLSASAYPAVTNARATDDYIARDKQWAIGATSPCSTGRSGSSRSKMAATCRKRGARLWAQRRSPTARP